MAKRAADASVPDVEREIDRLYRLPLDEFVAARNALSTSLRKAGRTDAAARVKTLEKPSVTAWAVNQVWWTDRHAFDAMIAAGRDLQTEQRLSLSGKGGRLREAVEARQRAIASVVDLAVRAMGGPDRVAPTMQHRLSATCDALSTGEAVEGVSLGRLTEDVQPSGLGALSALMSAAVSAPPSDPGRGRQLATVTPFRPRVTEAPPAPKAEPQARTPAADREARAAREREAARTAAAATLDAATRAHAEAKEFLDEQQTLVREMERAYEAAQIRVNDLERELIAARQRENDAKTALATARRHTSAAETARSHAAHQEEKASRALKDIR